jgi:hypothetical protein
MKGMLQSLESIISIIMVLTVFIVVFASRETLPEFDSNTWKLEGVDALKALDNNNELRSYAITNNTTRIEERLQSILPSQLSYRVVICDTVCANPGIEADNILSVSYFLAGSTDQFKPRKVVLYIW